MLHFLFLLTSLAAAPQPLQAVFVESPPEIDGELTDPAWEEAERTDCTFLQFGPDYGEEMTQPTEISILYDENRIYFGFFLHDPMGDQMVEALTPRDNYINGEWIAVLLDTWGDGREATSFEVSLANSQMDSKINPRGGWDYSWDAVWESGTARVPGGWTAEIAIPFSCLRFNSELEEQRWTVNFQRIMSRTSENGWYVLSEAGPMADLENFAHLTGVRGIQGSLGAEIRPYGSGRSYHTSFPGEWDHDYDAGVDVKVGVGSSLAADFTLNPDFGQVEADEAEMNLSHFELFRREKRPFFLESQNLFNMPFNMFYSRRIGSVAPNGEVIPIISGAKISGSLGGGYRMGFLDAVTASVSQEDELLVPARNYGVLRTVREFGTYTYLGLSAVSRDAWEQEGIDSDYSRAAALDGGFEVPGDHLVEFGGAGSWNRGEDTGQALRMDFSRIRSMTGYSFGGNYITESFDVNATGYTTQTGLWETWGSFWSNTRPQETFRDYGFDAGYHYSRQIGGEVIHREAHVSGHANLKNGINFGGELKYNGSYFDPWEGPEGRHYDDHADIFLRLGTDRHRPMHAFAGFGTGQWNTGGDFRNFTLRFHLRPTSAVELGVDGNMFLTDDGTYYNWDIEDWDKRDTRWRSLVFRANYIFTPDLHLRLFSQYSHFESDFNNSPASESGELTANVLFSWQYSPGSMIYLLVENLFTEKEEGGFSSPDVGLYAKATWYLPI